MSLCLCSCTFCYKYSYIIFFQLPPPVLDSFGRVVSEAPPDEWAARAGVAEAIGKLSPCLQESDQIESLFQFMVEKGLGDRNELVRKHMLQAAVLAINEHGKVREILCSHTAVNASYFTMY